MRFSDTQRRVAHQAASLLLGYPDEELLGRLPVLRDAVRVLPDAGKAPLERVLDHLAATPAQRLAADYVETFDLRRRCCPYLTYFTYGDTRKRGGALLRFRHAYRAAGMELAGAELPDHLAVVLEFSARGNTREAGRLLREHRAGLELLWEALRDAGSPYADVVAVVRATLPEPSPRDLAAAVRIAREGPPAEDVGLEPFDPLLTPPGGRR